MDGLGSTFRFSLSLLLCQRFLRDVSRRSTPQVGFVVDPDDGYDCYRLSPKRTHTASLTFLPLAACQQMKRVLGEFRVCHGFSNFQYAAPVVPALAGSCWSDWFGLGKVCQSAPWAASRLPRWCPRPRSMRIVPRWAAQLPGVVVPAPT